MVWIKTIPPSLFFIIFGGLAQLARASALHAEGQRFESVILHHLARETIFDMMKQKVKFSKELKVYIKPHTLHWINWYLRSNTTIPMPTMKKSVWKKVSKGAWRMPWLSEAMKDVISCDKLWVGANNPWSRDFRMGQPVILKEWHPSSMEANAGNWNILVPAGKENNNDSPSSGERTGTSPNHSCYGNYGVVGPRCRMTSGEKNDLESSAIDGDSPVF